MLLSRCHTLHGSGLFATDATTHHTVWWLSALAPWTSHGHHRTTGSPGYHGTSIHPCSRRPISSFICCFKKYIQKFPRDPKSGFVLEAYAPCADCFVFHSILILGIPPQFNHRTLHEGDLSGTKAMGSACGPGGGPFFLEQQ